MELEAFLTTDEVLGYLKTTPRTIYRLIRTGELPAIRIGLSGKINGALMASTANAQITKAPITKDRLLKKRFVMLQSSGRAHDVQHRLPRLSL